MYPQNINYYSSILLVFDTGREELPGNCALGQLTSIGFKQDITVGEHFRTVYVESGFLSNNFTSKELYVRSDGEFVYNLKVF